MDRSELDRQIAEVLEKGFEDSFAGFCATTFSSYNYPPENLAFARMHAFYLRMAMGMLNGEEGMEEIPYYTECVSIAEKSYRSALESDRPFHEVFVEMWCAFFSSKTE